MRTEPAPDNHMRGEPPGSPVPGWPVWATCLAAAFGIFLLIDSARSSSATYDEVAYLRIAARWWRTGQQDEITRMGSPLTFWKLQQAPVLLVLDSIGRRELVDEPERLQAQLLLLVRAGSLWVWLAAFGVTVLWARQLHGPRAMAFAAWLLTLSPNLLAHGNLVTMELPLTAAWAGVVFLFWRFLVSGQRRYFWSSAALSGLAFSCKFTAILLPPILAVVWWADLCFRGGKREARAVMVGSAVLTDLGDGSVRTADPTENTFPASGWFLAVPHDQGARPILIAFHVASRMLTFVFVMLAADWVVSGFALMTPSHSTGNSHPAIHERLGAYPTLARLATRVIETPVPQDWVGLLTQMNHQRAGGPSYLLGERRLTGWWYYYLVCLAVKVPLAFWAIVAARVGMRSAGRGESRSWMLPLIMALVLAITALGSSRNYGFRYLLPLAPLAIVWVSGVAERPGWPRRVALIGLAGYALAVATSHPSELTYFNTLAGGTTGGRRILADSNLDWGQGLRSLARLQRERPELADLTLYYFGDTEPRFYGVAGISHVIDAVGGRPGLSVSFEAKTAFVAVSASLQHGPWGPPGYFDALKGLTPVAQTDDTTIAVYRSDELDNISKRRHR